MLIQLEYYYDYRMKTDKWHFSPIKDIKFNECECKRNKKQHTSGEEEATKVSNVERSTNNSVAKDTHNQTNPMDKTKSSTGYHISELQKRTIEMDFFSFVNGTNIKDLVVKEIQEQKQITTPIDNQIVCGLKHYYNGRRNGKFWHRSLLRELKLKLCGKSTETDACTVQHVGIQCNADDFIENETEVLPQAEVQQEIPNQEPSNEVQRSEETQQPIQPEPFIEPQTPKDTEQTASHETPIDSTQTEIASQTSTPKGDSAAQSTSVDETFVSSKYYDFLHTQTLRYW